MKRLSEPPARAGIGRGGGGRDGRFVFVSFRIAIRVSILLLGLRGPSMIVNGL